MGGLGLWQGALFLWEASQPPLPPAMAEPFLPDLNAAPPHELLLLPGVGPGRAKAIAEGNRPYDDPSDLLDLPGIGQGTVAGLRGRVTGGARAPP